MKAQPVLKKRKQ